MLLVEARVLSEQKALVNMGWSYSQALHHFDNDHC